MREKSLSPNLWKGKLDVKGFLFGGISDCTVVTADVKGILTEYCLPFTLCSAWQVTC